MDDERDKLFEDREKYFAAWDRLDDIAAEAGGYVIPTKKGDPIHDIPGFDRRRKELGRELTEEETDEFIIGYVK